MDVMLAIEVLGLVKTVLRIEVKKWSCETAWCSDIVGARHCDVAVMAWEESVRVASNVHCKFGQYFLPKTVQIPVT